MAFEVFALGWILFFLTKALFYDGAPLPEPDLDASRWAAVIGGALCVVAGNLMPKANRSPPLRSAHAVERWPARRRGGAASASAGTRAFATGFAMVALGLALPARLVTPAVLLALLAGFVAGIVGSYVVYRQELAKR